MKVGKPMLILSFYFIHTVLIDNLNNNCQKGYFILLPFISRSADTWSILFKSFRSNKSIAQKGPVMSKVVVAKGQDTFVTFLSPLIYLAYPGNVPELQMPFREDNASRVRLTCFI